MWDFCFVVSYLNSFITRDGRSNFWKNLSFSLLKYTTFAVNVSKNFQPQKATKHLSTSKQTVSLSIWIFKFANYLHFTWNNSRNATHSPAIVWTASIRPQVKTQTKLLNNFSFRTSMFAVCNWPFRQSLSPRNPRNLQAMCLSNFRKFTFVELYPQSACIGRRSCRSPGRIRLYSLWTGIRRQQMWSVSYTLEKAFN
jgi:hypothetical protein